MTSFLIDQQLQLDTQPICVYQGFHVLLHRNASIPWFIVVPETHLTELYQLDADQTNTLRHIQSVLAAYLQRHCQAEKINIAAIGNIVRQLHVHVVGRSHADPCWPGVVWGVDYPEKIYTSQELINVQKILKKQLG